MFKALSKLGNGLAVYWKVVTAILLSCYNEKNLVIASDCKERKISSMMVEIASGASHPRNDRIS